MIKYTKYHNLNIATIIENLLSEDACVKCGKLYNQIETYSSIYESLEQFKYYNIKFNGKYTLAHSIDKKCKCKFTLENNYNKFSCNISYNMSLDKDLLSFASSKDFSIIRVNNIFDDSNENMRNLIRTQNKAFEFFTDYIMTVDQVKSHFINLIFE